jgi:DNA polymerase-3 subunit epsilon/ATP-dependent DNA helicase DinG
VSEQIYISLDLETTDLNPQRDEIIEIGAVKFCQEEIIDTFHSLVNPHRPVPYRVHLLCGITQSEVDAAPDFSSLVSALVSFIGTNPIIGHNISFDMSFLEQKGIKLPNPTYDTLELAKILLPQLGSHSLTSVAQHLGISYPVQHRALADAIATKDVFLALLDKASQLNSPTIGKVAYLAIKAEGGLGHLFEIEKLKGKTTFSFTESSFAAPSSKPLSPSPEKIRLDVEKLTAIFAPDGPLSRAFPDYEHRSEQVCMMQAAAQALNNSQHLIVEAGTGTGKSIAYLLPLLLFALQNNTTVVISTNTINLQEQLISKDIPDLLSALRSEVPIDNLCVVQLKGRSNYLCLRRWSSLLRSGELSPDKLKFLAQIQVWLSSTQTGDRAELNLSGDELSIWNKLSAQVDDCWAGNCPYQKRDACFLFRARKQALGAHLIITNHALLLSDIVAGTGILPQYRYLIIDEAHHLEEEATKQLGSQVTQQELLDYLSRIDHKVEGRHAGLLTQLRERVALSNIIPLRRNQLEQLTENLQYKVEEGRVQVSQFFALLRHFIQRYAVEHGETGPYERRLRLTETIRGGKAWAEVVRAWDNLSSVLRGIADALNELYIGMEDLSGDRLPDYENLMQELSSLLYINDKLWQRINSVVSHPQTNDIYWLSLSGADELREPSICTAPLTVGNFLEKNLFSQMETVILTGASLSTEGTFQYIKERLGLGDVAELLLSSPFDYQNSALLYIPSDIPEPGEVGYQEAVSRVLTELCSATQGQTLVLFTSYAALKATLASIRPPLEKESILVLGQGIDGSSKRLLEEFKSQPKAVLLGTASFWEGVDVAGEALSVLVMVKLPFNVPTDPIFTARSEVFPKPFEQYALPQAALRFKQGFGRLIRSKTDRGVIVVLDSRLKNKFYGKVFLNSIPPCTVVSSSSKELPTAVIEWLKGDS